MTRRPPKRFETAAMRAERLAQQAAAAAPDPLYQHCLSAVRRGMSEYSGGARRCRMKACKRARACVSDSFACLAMLRRPVLPWLEQHIAVDGMVQFYQDRAEQEAE
ncbi:hypothetical protein HNR60_001871 [Rhodopseudomonas rhenobacensis]|uniref:Uncharacterized protein n=1 Tax=Rhodopseudomonas rhenobacensis TaxID=87461 RepID=A0A7W8DYC5_9BRAD|nr:hypothetical protein [Rhodopseudomonas rhenobacensis]MBB5047119.1 hypothetical protein [Rhodopseudomonas rhenobacensis]